MNLVDEAITSVGLAKPTLQRECLRRRVIGVDMWAECPLGSEQAVAQARLGAMNTYLRLVAAVDEADSAGTDQGSNHAGMQLRFVAHRDDVHVTDEAICELLNQLADRLRWSKLVKLEEFDGVPAFAPLPSL